MIVLSGSWNAPTLRAELQVPALLTCRTGHTHPQASLPPSPALLPVFSSITFQIPHLHLGPCLGVCFWGTQDHWCLYPFLAGLILFVSHPPLPHQASETVCPV